MQIDPAINVLGSVSLKIENFSKPELSANELMVRLPSRVKAQSLDQVQSQTEPSQSVPSQTEPSEREASQTEPSEREASQTEPSEREASQTEPSERETSQTETSEREASQTEPSEREASEREQSESEPLETEPDVNDSNNVPADGVLDLTQGKFKKCFVKLQPLPQGPFTVSQEAKIKDSESLLSDSSEYDRHNVTTTPCSVHIESLSEHTLFVFSTVKKCSIVLNKLSALDVKRDTSKSKSVVKAECHVKAEASVPSKSMSRIKI